MGRATRHQNKLPTQSSFVPKRPKDYSKQNLLRKKSVKQELISTRSSTKLNAVMQMDPPGSRRRLGRNPIAEQQHDSSSSPTDADSSNEAVPGGSGNSAECRRSSRKKTIKFDVRDLLNKNRKSHKIQIEARIDSNAPKVGAGPVSRAELDSKQKNFIEKSAIFRRYSISENKLPPRPPPPPGALIHTIQQCVGELEQLPLDGGELNLAAISPIARRLSRTQDILTASMMKPKQVSSLIVTKLESASTSKAAVATSVSAALATPARRRVFGGYGPSTSAAIQQKPQKRGRKPKAKVFAESTTESSSSSASNDCFDLSASKRTSGEKSKSKEELQTVGHKISILDENSTTGIDLKESLDASAVTLPQPTILNDCMHNSTDESFVAAEEDLFTSRNHSSDESTTGSMGNSPKGRTIDEISLFGRSNSTETNSSDDSEKRRRKMRVAVKRVSLTPQKSPLGSSFGENVEPIELLSSTNDENSNEYTILNQRKPATKALKEKQIATCSTPPIVLLESDASNAAPVGSSVTEITNYAATRIDEPGPSTNTRRGRSCKLIEDLYPKPTTQEVNFKAVQKLTVPQNIEVSLRNRSSSRKSATNLPIESIAASSPSTCLKEDAQTMGDVISPKKVLMVETEDEPLQKDISLSQNSKSSPTTLQVNHKETDETCHEKSECSEEKVVPQIRSLRSAQSVQVKPPTPATSKRQRKNNKVQATADTPTEDDNQTQVEMSDKEVLPMISKDGQLKSVQDQESSFPSEKPIPSSNELINSDSPQSLTVVKQSVRCRKDALDGTKKRISSESDKQEQVVSSKQTRSRSMKKQDKLDDPNLNKDPTILPEEELGLKTDEKTNEPTVQEEDSKSEVESTIGSTDRSSTDTTTSNRRESLRMRSSVVPTKKQTSKKISKVIANSSTPDSSSDSSECHEKSPKNRMQIKLANVMDDKSKEETSSLCSESSSNGFSTSSSSSSSSTGSSSTTSSSSSSSPSSTSSSSSSSSSDGRSTRSSRNAHKVSLEQQPQVTAIGNKSPITPDNIKTQPTKSDSESSENFSKTDSIKEKYNDVKFNELEKLMGRRKSSRLEHWSSEQKRDIEESESSDAIQHTSKTRSGRSRGRVEREARQKLPKKSFQQEFPATGVEIDNIVEHETSIHEQNDKQDESTTNQENKSECLESEASLKRRSKSKKRTRRFVPIKYSSSESGSLSDDGNPSSKNSSVRLTRTRRKTISSASDFEDIPSGNLSPPDLALEYLPRKSKQTEVKSQELTDQKDEKSIKPEKGEEKDTSAENLKSEQNKTCVSKTEKESTQESVSKIVRSTKLTRNVSKCSSGVKKDDSTDISKESESDQSSKDIGSKQEVQQSGSASPSSSVSSRAEGQVDALRQRKVTRLSLKTQGGDPRNNDSHVKSKGLECSLDNQEQIDTLQKDVIEKLPDTCSDKLKDDQEAKPTIQALEDIHRISEESSLKHKNLSTTPTDLLDSVVVSQSKSPKQRKGTKISPKSSQINLISKEECKEKLTEQKDDGADKPCDQKTSQICSLKNDPLKEDLDKSPNIRKVTRLTPKSLDFIPSPEININDLSHENSRGKDKEVEVQESKEYELVRRKGTRLSMKRMETTNSEKISKESLANNEKNTKPDSLTLDVSKSDEVVKTPRQRKPTRFSPKSLEELKLEDQQTKEDSTKIDENDGQKEQDSSSSRITKTTRLTPKNVNVKDVQAAQQEEPQPFKLKVDEHTEDPQLKSDSEAAMDGKSKILEKTLVAEPLDNSLSDALKLAETPKRKRKPTRFSPKSPDQPEIEEEEKLVGSETILPHEMVEEASIDRLDEVKKTEELSNLSTSSVVSRPEGLLKSPRVRKGTRFSPKNQENLQMQHELLKSKESQSPTCLENKEESRSVLEIPDVSNSSLETTQLKEPAKLTRARKATQLLAKTSENLQIEEELKKSFDDSQSNVVFENSDVCSSSSLEAKQVQETVKSSSSKKGTRFSLKAAQESPINKDITKVELQITELQDCQDDTTRASRHKRKTTENELFADIKGLAPTEVSIVSVTSGDQPHLITENDSEKIYHSQLPEEITQEPIESPTKQPAVQEEAIKCLEQTINSDPISPSISPPFKPELISKKGLKKQLQAILDSHLSENKVTTQNETTPRRKRKTLEPQQEAINPAQESPITKKTDEPNREVEMKIPSSDSNLSDDSIKLQEGTTKIDQKHTPRRQLDSSFIESLEKSLLRPISTKKSSKKKEKDKETIEVPSPKPPKEDSKKPKKSQEPSEELKKSETSSPKLKKKQPKESPKIDKKHSEEQTTSKRKSMAAVKTKELEEIKSTGTESSLSDVLNDVTITKQSSEVFAFNCRNTQTPKTKAQTKFFSPEKPLIPHEPPSPIQTVKEPVAAVVVVKEKSPDLLPDPLKDIEKFIEDGVNLLKRCYKIDADDDASLDRDILKPDEITPKKCKLDESLPERKPEDTPPHDDNSNSNSESSTMTTNTSTSEIDTPNGIRRSHRIKNNTKSTKFLVGRGLVRERERFSTKDDEKTIYSIDDQKMDLAEVEAKNSQFLKDMEERLSNFRVIRENEYKCERVISKEAKRMLCDCFLTREEEERGELGCGEDCLNRLLMIECGGDCTVRERCTNRRFNKFLYSPCRVFRTEKKGFGIMADIEILPGEFIMEYVGEVINGDEFEIRINEYSKDKNKHYYFMALRSDAVIDATAKGNISRFINHSCDPNAETQKWTVNGELRIGFFSRKSIMPGEEITFDYQYQRYGKEAQKCYCESSNCRGWIGAEPSSEEEEYEGVDEDESEEFEEEEPAEAVVPFLVAPSSTPPIIDVAHVEEQPLVPVVATEVPAIDAEIVPLPQPVAVPTPLVEPVPIVVPEIPKDLPPKKKKEKKRLLEEKLKRREPKQFLEDPDIEDEVRFLVKCGLRNQADTLRLSRLIVRAKLLETRINLLQILRQGELPCRRLFLDYHGLRLLHGWMSEVIDTRDTEKSMEIRMELLSALECLPISNKTMLTDSKVYQTVRDWSNNKESHSPSDGSPKEGNANSSSSSPTLVVPPTEESSSELQKLAAKLVHTWDNLPEVFRIPKRERIEQMKEHEREADRQYKVLGRGMMSGSDRNRNRERFMSKSGQKGRFKWSKDKERERANERRKYAQSNSSGKDGTDKSTGSLPGESHLSKEQRRELFAAKVARDEAEKRQAEERREFDIKCRFFGLDPKRMRPDNMPFCVNPSTGQWYSTDKKAISTPPSYAHVQVPVKPKSTNPEDYQLPEMDLPPLWKFAISPKGKIYYYHVKIRIPQWEPPIKILPLAGQHNTEVKNSESDSSTAGIIDSSEDDIEVIKGLDPVKLQAYIEKKIEDRRLQRYNRLVEEKPISPRKEEDRIYNQMEVRKYKENKEKIRKRKEEIRRRRDIIGKQQTPLDSSNLSETTEAGESVADILPIQDYLLSSEEEEIIKAECNNSPLIDKIVQGDKIVDELDALQRKRSLKRSLPIRDKYEHKKRKVDKNKDSSKSTKRSKDGEGGSSSSKYRKVREKFRCEIAGIIVPNLKPYRNESCITGKILTDDDFNHLARKLTHFVMVKELKYCESIGQTLIVTESVKNKSREFIKKYMAKYGKVYVRPKNDPEFKDIPFL